MSKNTKNGTTIMRVICAIFFLLFTFLYLFNYQADILSLVQHVLSHGATHYERTIGAILITLVLWLIQIGVYALTRLNRYAHALTYFPSFLLLAVLTDVTPNILHESYLGHWVWGFPLLLVIYAGVVWICRQLETLEQQGNMIGVFSRNVWLNLLGMVAMSVMVVFIGCSDELFHYRMRIENDLSDGRYEHATQVGIKEETTDSSLTMLRIWALSENNCLGDRLFEYPLVGGSDAMMPNGSSVQLMMVPEIKLYKYLGAVFTQKLSPKTYLEKLHAAGKAKPAAHDWLLCAYLLDGELDKFVTTLEKYDSIGDHLPKHYREALILYAHQRSHPRVVYHHSVMDADFKDFQAMAHKYSNKREQYSKLRDSYGKTYWFYYKYK